MKQNFSVNLRSLCADQGSISYVCRQIGINRQQFNRYLSGESLPAAHNLRKISAYFGITEANLFESCGLFAEKHLQHVSKLTDSPVDLLTSTFTDQSKRMRRYLGYYHVYVVTPSWDGQILRSLTCLYERNGYVVSRTIQRATSGDGSIRQRTKFEGLSSNRGNRIYVIEREEGDDGAVVETILYPAHRQQVNYLRGLTLGVASRPYLSPYSSRTIWKRINARTSAREALKACGVCGRNGRRVEPKISEFLNAPGGNIPF